MLWKVNWNKTAKNFEGKSHKFMHASRRLNILSNDLLRYIDLSESLANLARQGQTAQAEYDIELIKLSKISKKEKHSRTASWHRLRVLHDHLNRVHKSIISRTKELKKTNDTYEEHLKKFSKALKA